MYITELYCVYKMQSIFSVMLMQCREIVHNKNVKVILGKKLTAITNRDKLNEEICGITERNHHMNKFSC